LLVKQAVAHNVFSRLIASAGLDPPNKNFALTDKWLCALLVGAFSLFVCRGFLLDFFGWF
jgi:hypothetical protein